MSNNNTSESASPGSRFGLSNIFGLLISPSKRGGLPPPDPTNAEPTSHVNNGSNSAAMATGQTTAAAQTLRPIPGANINNHGGNNGSVSVTIGGSIITTTHRDTYHGAPAPHHVAPAPRPNPNNNNRNNKNNSIDAVDNQDTRNPKDLRYNEDDQKNFVIPDGLIPEKKMKSIKNIVKKISISMSRFGNIISVFQILEVKLNILEVQKRQWVRLKWILIALPILN